jgi:hypothetical protein
MKKNKLKQKKRWLPPVFKTTYFRTLLNLYFPFFGAGIKVTKISEDFRRFEVEMKLRWYNRNFVNTHFGGSLYAMSDPFYMFILMENLGENYIVWDKSAKIDFVKPGSDHVFAVYEVNEEEINLIKEELEKNGKMNKEFRCEIKMANGEVVAKIEKVLYLRKLKK